jgi:hypothetical protein
LLICSVNSQIIFEVFKSHYTFKLKIQKRKDEDRMELTFNSTLTPKILLKTALRFLKLVINFTFLNKLKLCILANGNRNFAVFLIS